MTSRSQLRTIENKLLKVVKAESEVGISDMVKIYYAPFRVIFTSYEEALRIKQEKMNEQD